MKSHLVLLLVNALLTILLLAGYATLIAPARPPRHAMLDVGELYRLKEKAVAARLSKAGAGEAERADILKDVVSFNHDIARLIEALPAECQCLIFARGALLAPESQLTDLTPAARRRLGL